MEGGIPMTTRGTTSRAELGDRAERLVCDLFDGDLAVRGQRGYDLICEAHGRVQVKARCRASKHLNWFHVKNVHLREFDYLVLVEFEANAQTVAGAWGMPWEDVALHAHSTTRDDVTKFAIRGEWKAVAEKLDL
jgi:hypothetical protein